MKKAIFIALVLVGWVSIGLVLQPAHAAPVIITVADITPEQAAILNAELNAMKDTLIQIQGQYGTGGSSYQPVPQVPQATTPTGLSAESRMQISQTLGSLATTLMQMQNTLAAGNSTQQELDNMSVALQGVGNSVSAIVAAVAAAQTGGGQAIAEAPMVTPSPQPTTAFESAPMENTPEVTGSDETEGTPADEASESGIAQASSAVSGRRWIVPAIIVLIIIIAAVWFWRSKGEAPKPKPQTQAVQTTQKESSI